MSVGKDGSSLSEVLRSDQRQRWLRGERVGVEVYLAQYPELSSDPEQVVSLAYSEFCLREELGESPDPQEYLARFPDHRNRLERLLETPRVRPSGCDAQTVEAPRNVPRQLSCPFCDESMSVSPVESVSQVRCSHCGKRLLVIDETVTYHDAVVGVVGRFQLLESLGRGAFGDVWRARDTELERDVALKLPRRLPEQGATRRAFLREARAAARLKHPNIVPVYDVYSDSEQICIVSALIRGWTLKEHSELRGLTPQEAARLCETLARALDHAHQAGVIHRDLKPGNVLIDHEGQPHITDFGLAKQPGDELTVTLDGKILGTPAYMSPEQARGEGQRVDHRCDVYALGVILYELLTGRRPFLSKGDALIHDILHHEPPPPRQLNPAIPADLETICRKAISKHPAARYSSALEMAIDLELFLKGEPISGQRLPILQRAWRWSQRNRIPLSSAAFVGIVMLATGMALRGRSEPPAPLIAPARRVSVETNPPGAQMHFIPLDAGSGEPRPLEIIHSKTPSPVTMDLQPGNYLVVVVWGEGSFHEVQRHIPKENETIVHSYNHNAWKMGAEGTIVLPGIDMPKGTVHETMALIEGSSEFSLGEEGSSIAPKQKCRVPSFYIDVREFTVGDFRRLRGQVPVHMRDNPPPDEAPLTYENWDSAMHTAERSGKRLMTEVEYEYAATAKGKHRFPWGDEFPAALPEAQDFITRPDTFDRLDTTPPVLGLCSGVAEWTASRPTLFDPDHDDRYIKRIVRGGSAHNVAGNPKVDDYMRNPRMKVAVSATAHQPGLGFRCARSAQPRLRPEDFVTSLPQ